MQVLFSIWGCALALCVVLGLVALYVQRGQHDQELEMPHWLDAHILSATPASGTKVKPNASQFQLMMRHWWHHGLITARTYNALIPLMLVALCYGVIGLLLAWRG